MKKQKIVGIPKKRIEWIQQILKTKPKSEADCFGEDETYSVTAAFENNIEMDIKLCGVQYEEGDDNLPWTEAVLFDNGCEVCHTDVCNVFMGVWELEYNGISYEVTVKVED